MSALKKEKIRKKRKNKEDKETKTCRSDQQGIRWANFCNSEEAPRRIRH